MPFLGSQPADQYQSLAKQTITGDGSTAYTLSRSVTNAYDMEVFINNVRQEPDTSYTASGNTITFTAAVTASDSCYLIYQGQSVGSINPPANSVGGNQIQNTSVTTAHLHTSLDLSSKTLTMPAGHVIQVVQSRYTTASVVAVDAFTFTGLEATITPKSTSSKIMVQGYLMGHGHNGNQEGHYFRLHRQIGSGSIDHLTAASGAAAGARIGTIAHMPAFSGDDEGMQTIPYDYLDSPSTTSAVTYKMFSRGYNSGSYYGYLNRSMSDIDRYHNARGVCSMTLMEIA